MRSNTDQIKCLIVEDDKFKLDSVLAFLQGELGKVCRTHSFSRRPCVTSRVSFRNPPGRCRLGSCTATTGTCGNA